MIKLADYLIQFIESLGVSHVFLISGGGNIHIIDSAGKAKKLKYVCNHHEQSSAMAAEAYSRITGNIGVCIVTTGPGATNAITGVMGAWLDSIPVLVISGQVKREMIGAGRGLRQLGDQEINIVDIVKPITKYAVTIENPQEIRYELEKAVYLAKSGRPGPVWIDIPLDVQGARIDENKLKSYKVKVIPNSFRDLVLKTNEMLKQVQHDKVIIGYQRQWKIQIKEILEKLSKSRRPVLYVGNGVRLAGAQKELLRLIKLLKIPVLTSFVGYDLVGTDNPYFFGRPGTVGQRGANFILQNCDFLLTIGARLNIRSVGYNYPSFAPRAFKVMVDIDEKELSKKTVKPDLAICADAKEFIEHLTFNPSNSLRASIQHLTSGIRNQESGIRYQALSIKGWIDYGRRMNKKYPVVLKDYWQEKGYVDPYCFVETLGKRLKTNDIITVANGTACVVPYQALTFPQGTRIIVNSGCASMGYGLPAAIGACFANGKKDVICIEGDGSIQMNIQELQTVVHHNLPIKIFILNNRSYLSIRLTQRALFGGKYVASDPKSGVSCPDIKKVAKAYGIKAVQIKNHKDLERKIARALSFKGPVVCEVMLDPKHEFRPKSATRVLPDGTFVSTTLEDMYPFLSKDEMEENKII